MATVYRLGSRVAVHLGPGSRTVYLFAGEAKQLASLMTRCGRDVRTLKASESVFQSKDLELADPFRERQD